MSGFVCSLQRSQEPCGRIPQSASLGLTLALCVEAGECVCVCVCLLPSTQKTERVQIIANGTKWDLGEIVSPIGEISFSVPKFAG